MSAIWFRALALPLALAAIALIAWPLAGAAIALGILALGALALLGWHLFQLDALARWATGPLETPVPEGRGSWALAYAALYRRVRLRSARQRDLRLALDRFVSGAEALPDGVVVLDARDRIRWANLRAQTHLGIDLSRDVEAPIVNFVRQPAFVHYLAAGDFSEPVVVPSQRAADTTLSIQVVPFGEEEKLLMSRDITRLEVVARMRRDFIANVSHELKTPITVLSGFLETFADLKLDERQRRRYLAMMQEQAQNMRRLVDDLLTLSSLESDTTLQETEFAIVPLLLKVSADAKALSGGRHEVALSIRDAANVIGNPEELASAFGNLVSNAVRYTPDGGRVALDWRVTPGGGGEFSVADTGIGVAAEHIPRLTERFYRVDRSRSRATGGTGLGLAIVKHVLIRHQAEIAIDSAPGQGSRFTVRLPARRVKAVEAASHPTPLPACGEREPGA